MALWQVKHFGHCHSFGLENLPTLSQYAPACRSPLARGRAPAFPDYDEGMGVIYSSRAEIEGRLRGVSDLEQYAKWFVRQNMSFVLRNDGGTWLCEAVGRHGDVPFSARSGRCGTVEAAVHECFLSARDTLRGEPYIMG